MERPFTSSWSGWEIKGFGGEPCATNFPGYSESEERPSRVREVSEEEHGEDGGQHDDRQGDEDRGVDGPGDRLFRGTGLRLEDVHIPDHARVIVEGQGAI